jgi:hypothetical protein
MRARARRSRVLNKPGSRMRRCDTPRGKPRGFLLQRARQPALSTSVNSRMPCGTRI